VWLLLHYYLTLVKVRQVNNMEQELSNFPSLPDTSTFGVNSPQMAQIRAKRPKMTPNRKKDTKTTIAEQTNISN